MLTVTITEVFSLRPTLAKAEVWT